MKILFIGSGCACRLPFVEYLFKKKIQEAEVPDIEVESADMAMWGVTSNESGIPKSTSGKEHLVGSVCGDLDYQTQDEEMTNGCMNLIARIKAFLKEHLGEKTEISTLITA